MSQVKKFLGMRMALNDSKTYTIDQTSAIDEMLQQHGLDEAKSVRAPIGDDRNDDVLLCAYRFGKRGKKGEPNVLDF